MQNREKVVWVSDVSVDFRTRKNPDFKGLLFFVLNTENTYFPSIFADHHTFEIDTSVQVTEKRCYHAKASFFGNVRNTQIITKRRRQIQILSDIWKICF